MMARLLLTLMVLVASMALILSSHRRRLGLRVLHGLPDTKNKYSFVVALLSNFTRYCSGTLISPVWVLTAAHCSSISYDIHGYFLTHVQYGDMTKAPNSTHTKAEVEEEIRHPGYRPDYNNDIALVRVTPISLPKYGKISAVDFRSLMGVAVEYAGFGTTEFDDDEDTRPRIIGEGVVMPCLDYTEPGLYMCVAPKCSNKHGDSAAGDSGGPLFFDEKIVGIVMAGVAPIGSYTAVSPYVVWIREVMMSNRPEEVLDFRRNFKIVFY